MKALAIIVQTKRGENAFVVTSNNFTQQMAQEYSHTIYNIIIQSFKKAQRVDRTFLFKRDVSAVCNIGKDMIIQVIVPNAEAQYGVECLKKANELLTKHAKSETTLKKYIEIFSCLEELIYSRDYSPLKLHLSLKPSEIQSSKKSIDLDIFSKFPLLTNDNEKGLIQNVPLKYSKRAFTQHREGNLRYQVVKTCHIPINKPLNNETQLKRFYRHNLSNHAFNKNQARPTITKAPARQSTMPKVLPSANTGYNNIANTITNLDASTYDVNAISASSNDISRGSMYGGNQYVNGNMESPPKTQYDNNMEIFNRSPIKSGNNSPEGSKPRVKIFEEKKEVKIENSFNSFSHDMFNTVSLPANINLEKYSENYPQASPRSSKNFNESSSSNTPSAYNSNTRENVSEIFSFPAASNISSTRTSMNGNVQQNQYDTSDIYNEYQNINPVPNLTSSNAQGTQVQDSWDLLNLIPVTTTSSNINTNTNVNGQQNRESVTSFQDTGFSPRTSFTNIVNVSESVTKASIKILKIMEKFYITLKNSKVQNLRVAGQIAVEVDDNSSGIMPHLNLVLSPPNIWEDESKINKRPNRKDLILSSKNSFYQLQLGKLKGNVPLFDYLVNQKFVDPNKIPLFFIYKVESPGQGKCNILLQYKINEKLNQSFYDVDITVDFKAPLSQFGVKTVPNANNVGEKSVTWKAKSVDHNSKGKLGVSLDNCHDTSGGILEDIKVTLKGMSLIHNEMNAYASLNPKASADQFTDTNIFTTCHKRQIIEYKVLANDP